jgi:hypothetical protein
MNALGFGGTDWKLWSSGLTPEGLAEWKGAA